MVLGTDTKVATINAALHAQALKAKAAEMLAALDSAEMDFGASEVWLRRGPGLASLKNRPGGAAAGPDTGPGS